MGVCTWRDVPEVAGAGLLQGCKGGIAQQCVAEGVRQDRIIVHHRVSAAVANGIPLQYRASVR